MALHEYLGNQISKQEFMGRILAWSYHYVFERSGYMPRHLPKKPIKIHEYDIIPFGKKPRLSDEAMDGIKKVRHEWLDRCDKVKNENDSDLRWLRKMLGYYKYKGDTLKSTRLSERIRMFESIERSDV